MAYDDPMEDMHRLRQTGSVLEYKSQFEVISNRIQGMTAKINSVVSLVV